MKDRASLLAEAAWEALVRLARELVARKAGGHVLENQLRRLELPLSLELEGPEAGPNPFAERLVAVIEQQLDDAVQEAAAFRPGHAWCHRCESAHCPHSRPSSCRHVFIGYTPTGLPRWQDFAQYCLDLRDPRVDRLFEEPPALLTVVQGKDALGGSLVRAFRNGPYELLGQVAAGFFPVRTRAEEGRGVLALTIQVGASRRRAGPPALGLNVLGLTPAGEELGRLWERQEDLPWRPAILWAQSALETLRPGPARESRVAGILLGLARRLERGARGRARRTRHAEQRHVSGSRPTRNAVDDARAAGPGALFVDERSGALVVLGERGRTHFFTTEGQIVSSARYSREAIARKLKHELWREATPELSRAFKAKLPA